MCLCLCVCVCVHVYCCVPLPTITLARLMLTDECSAESETDAEGGTAHPLQTRGVSRISRRGDPIPRTDTQGTTNVKVVDVRDVSTTAYARPCFMLSFFPVIIPATAPQNALFPSCHWPPLPHSVIQRQPARSTRMVPLPSFPFTARAAAGRSGCATA